MSEIDPLLLTLAQLIGIAKVEGDDVELQSDWFSDPLTETQTSIKNHPNELVEAITQLLGEVGGNALGVPVTNPALLGTWYPLNFGDITTGLYLVSYPSPDNEDVQVIGVGSLVKWAFPDNEEHVAAAQAIVLADGQIGPDAIEVLAWGLVPLIELGDGNLDLALGKLGRPFVVGAAIEGADDQKLFDGVDISLQGIKTSASLDIEAENPVDLSLVFMNLKLPNASEARDISLVDLAALPNNEILSSIAAIALSALAQLGIDEDKLTYVLPVLGLAENVPGASGTVPNIDWVGMSQAAANGGNPIAPLLAWLAELLDTPSSGEAWLHALGELLGSSAPTITGSGTRNDPLALVLASIDSVGHFEFTLGSENSADGVRRFYPGLSLVGDPQSLGGDGIDHHSDGVDDYVLAMDAKLELGQIDLNLNGGVSSQPSSLRGQAGFVFRRSDPSTLLYETETPILLSLERIEAGIVLAEGMQLQPAFELVNVTTANGQYDALNLLHPEEIAQVGIETLISEIIAKLEQLLSIDGTDDVAFGSAVGVLIGLTQPTIPEGDTWPAIPPLSAAGLLDSIKDPIGAIAGYYDELLTQDVGSTPAFTYLVQAMGTLLAEAGGPTIEVQGAGTPVSPWRVGLASSPAHLLVFQNNVVSNAVDTAVDAEAPATLLTFGFDVTPQLTFVNQPTIDLGIVVHLVQVAVNEVSIGNWLPLVSASIALTETLETPSILGAKVAIDGASLEVGWQNTASWSWNMTVSQPSITVGTDTLKINEDLVFADTTQLSALMSEANFATLLTRLMGLFMSRTTQPAALALDGVFGLLPNLSSYLPDQLDWPADMPVLTPANFDTPIADLQAQLKAITSVPVNLKAATGVVGWAITNGDSVPTINGEGTTDNPFRLPLDFAAGFDARVFEGVNNNLGLGLGRRDSSEPVVGVEVVTDIQLLMVEVPLGGGSDLNQALPDTPIPSLKFSVTITSTTGNIATYMGAEVSGFAADLEFSLNDGLVVTPQTYLVTDQGNKPLTDNDQAYFTALNTAFAFAIDKLKDDQTFQQTYRLFADLGLLLTDNAGISTSGWSGLFANPLTWMTNGIETVLGSSASRDNFFTLLQQMLGINMPTVPTQILDVMSALGFLDSADMGYAPLPESLVELASSPVTTLTGAANTLLKDSTARQALISAIAGSTQGNFGVLTWSVANGDEIQISIAQPVAVGSFLSLSGGFSLDLANGILKTFSHFYVPQVRITIAPEIDWQLDQPTSDISLTVNTLWGDGTTPSAPALTLFPFSQQVFIDQVTAIGPTQAVSSFVSMALDVYVIKPYPLASVFMQGLGLLVEQDDKLTFKSLLGLFDNPLSWLLSGAVFGADGTLDIERIGQLLVQIPPTSGSGITVAQLTDTNIGVKITGLPYEVELTFEVEEQSTNEALLLMSLHTTQSVSDNVATLSLLSSLTLDRTFQPGILGGLKVEQTSTEVYVETGFNEGFTLSLGQTDGATLDLFPFGGWQALIEAAAVIAVQALIKELTGYVIEGLSDTSAGDFVQRLQTAGGEDQLDVESLVTSLSATTTPEDILQAALAWLGGRLTEAGAPGTSAAVVTLLTGYIPGDINTNGGLVSWAPSKDLPVTLLSGRDTEGLLGFWAEVDFPETGLLDVTVARTGVGVDPVHDFAVGFRFGLDALVPVVIANSGPALLMSFDSASNSFSMMFDPQRDNQVASPLQVELLPTFFDGVKLDSWLLQVLTWVVPRYGSLILFNLSQVRAWLDSGVVAQSDAPTPAMLLEGGGLIEEDQGKYVLKSFVELEQLTPQKFIGGFLTALLTNPLKVISIGTDGGIYLEHNEELGYGARIQATDISVNALPYIDFQLGATDDTWIEKTKTGNGVTPQPGLAAYLPIADAPAYTPDFAGASLVLANVGLDIHGKNQSPLVTVSRFSMQEVSPRGLLELTFNNLDDTTVGGSIAFKNMGWALAPDALPQGANINPVAANLLGSGSDDNDENPPTDPTFTAIAAYTQPGTFWAGLLDSSDQATNKVILPIQQSFGPLNVQQVAMLWDNPERTLGIGFTGGLELDPLSITVFDLTVGVDVRAPLTLSSYDLDLRGLAVAFNAGSIDIAGGLVKDNSGEDVIYNGGLNVNVGRFGISAVGSYGMVTDTTTDKKYPSFFVFAASAFPLGGPPAFFVTGFSGGFAYNRTLILPQPDEVQDFILVKAASDPDSVFGKDPTPSQALSEMSKVVKPEVGSYWLAAGINFTSYSMLTTTALVVVEFGNTLAFSLLGLSTLTQPPLVKSKDKALVFAQLGLVVTANITEGSLLARAQLTPNSFVLDQACKLTGGFAFALWWSPNPHSGDFCLTLGGYNPNYTPPDYYPVVPRLGLRWPLSGISILGEAYFALTSNAVMAGGRLELEFEAGPLSAWFKANADFIIAWKPFYYDVDISISVGAALTTKLFGTTITLKAEIGAILQLWGPPTAGKVAVNWYVISFTIPIGDQSKNLEDKPLGSWQLFAENFLPSNAQPNSDNESVSADVAADEQEVLKLQIPRGLNEGEADAPIWSMQRIGFELRADSAVPINNASAGELTPIKNDTVLGVRPMDISTLTSAVTFTLKSGGDTVAIESDTFDIIPFTDNSPMGLWATTPLETKTAPATSTVIGNTMVGTALVGDKYQNNGQLGPIDLTVFDTESISDMNLPLTVNAPYAPSAPLPQTTPIQTVMDTIMQSSIVDERNRIFTALQARSLVAPLNPDLNVMAAQGDNIFQAPPVLAEIGQTLAESTTSLLRKAIPTVHAQAEIELLAPRSLGGARRYAGRMVQQDKGRFAYRSVGASWVTARKLGVADKPKLRRGALAVWQLDSRATHKLSIDGGLGVRVLGFDQRFEPCFTENPTAGYHQEVMLPTGLDHAVVCGAENRPMVAGWQRGSALVKVNARYFLGDDCLIKPQAIVRQRNMDARGVCQADHMLDLNQVEHIDGRRQGWVTTWLPSHHDVANVLLNVNAEDAEFAVIEQDKQGRLVRRILNPVIVDGDDCDSKVAVLAIAEMTVDGWIRLMVRTQHAEQLNGVISTVNVDREKSVINRSANESNDAANTAADFDADLFCLGGDAHCLSKLSHVNVSLTLQGDAR